MLWLAISLLALACVTASAIQASAARRGLEPPGLRPGAGRAASARRVVAVSLLAVALFLAVYQPLIAIAEPVQLPETVPAWQLFWVHIVLGGALVALHLLGFGWRLDRWRSQLGLATRAPWTELGLGLAGGVAGWLGVLILLMLLGLALVGIGLESWVPSSPAPLIALLAGLPWALRLAISLSAGVVEELFFRGYLQPRIGIAGSTGLFVLAHVGYGEPLMLVGVGSLSVLYGLLAAWRRGVIAAIAAHATFDAIQLLVVIPILLRAAPSDVGSS